jgi:hypothetical protein
LFFSTRKETTNILPGLVLRQELEQELALGLEQELVLGLEQELVPGLVLDHELVVLSAGIAVPCGAECWNCRALPC